MEEKLKLQIECDEFDGYEKFALIGAGYTANQSLLFLAAHKDKMQLVVDSNMDLHGNMFSDSEITISSMANLSTFDGCGIIACSGGKALRDSCISLGMKKINYFYNYTSNREFYSPIIQDMKKFQDILNLFQDKISIDSLRALIEGIEYGNYKKMMRATSPIPFFGQNNFIISKGERIIDLGSYKGNHLSFLTLGDLENIEKIICVEPNTRNNIDLQNLFVYDQRKDSLWRQKLVVMNVAVSDFRGFGENFGGSIANRVVANLGSGDKVLEGTLKVFTLDDFIDFAPTLITADIEGDELRMLKGGTKLIMKHKPKFAISTYHEPLHLKLILEYFVKFDIQVKFRFRLHDYGFMDQTVYVDFL